MSLILTKENIHLVYGHVLSFETYKTLCLNGYPINILKESLKEYLNNKNVIEPYEFKNITYPCLVKTILDYGYLLSQEELEYLSDFMVVPEKYIQSNNLKITENIIDKLISNNCNINYETQPGLFNMELLKKCAYNTNLIYLEWIVNYMTKFNIKPNLEILDLVLINTNGQYSRTIKKYIYSAPNPLLFSDELLDKYSLEYYIYDPSIDFENQKKYQITKDTRNQYKDMEFICGVHILEYKKIDYFN